MSKRTHADDMFTGPDDKVRALDPSSVSASTLISGEALVNVPQPPPANRRMPNEGRQHHVPSGIITQLASQFTAPAPCHDEVTVIVDSANYVGYFTSLYQTLVHLLYPDFDPAAQLNVITEANFNLVCRYFMKARVDTIYGKVSGRRPPRRIPIPVETKIPAALAVILNGIGTITVQGGAFFVIPEPEAVNAADVNANLDAQVTHLMLRQFSQLVLGAINRGLIREGTISTVTTGTAYWLLTARSAANQADIVAQDGNHAVIYGIFKEWTPNDALLAAIALNQYDGLFGGDDHLKFTTEPCRSITTLRATFNANA